MSEPSTEELQHAFEDLVGQPRPPADLAGRARTRGTTLRRQRMAGGLTAVVVVGTLSVPALAFVRDQAQSPAAGLSVASQPKAADPAAQKLATSGTGTAKADRLKASALAAEPANGGSKVDGVGPTVRTDLRQGTLTALDSQRVAAAKSLLGSEYTVDGTEIAVDATSGATRGAVVTFAGPGGAMVGIEWSTGEHSIAGTSASVGPKAGTDSKDPKVSGQVLVVNGTEWDLKVVEGTSGSVPGLGTPDEQTAFLQHLSGS